MLAAILLARGRTAEARAAAEDAMQRLSTLRAFGYRGAFVHLVHAEALDAAGEHAERPRSSLPRAIECSPGGEDPRSGDAPTLPRGHPCTRPYPRVHGARRSPSGP